MQRTWFVSLVVALVMALFVCGPMQAAERKIVMRIGTVTVPPQLQSQAAEEFKRLVEAKVGDRLEVQLYHSSQLGTIPQHLQGLQNGSIHAICMPNGFPATVAPELAVLDLPFFFPNADWVYKMFNKGYMEPLYEAGLAKGLMFISAPPAPDREIFLSKPVNSLEDFAGVRVRTYPNPISQQGIGMMGFTPVNIDSSEMAVAIQQGTVDGIETDRSFWFSQKLFRSEYVLDIQGSMVHMFTVSKRWFSNLPEDIQKAIVEAGLEVAPIINKHMHSYLLPMIANDPAAKLTVLPVSDEMREELRRRTLPVHEMYIKMGPTYERTYNYYKDLIERYPNGDAPSLIQN